MPPPVAVKNAGSWGLGAAVFDVHGEPRWALSITGVEGRLAPPRQQQLGQRLLAAAHALTTKISARPAPR
ncbi:MAG: hypothetical protein Q8Q02_10450 [Nocardioides sp.]|nr:hypothetical protein [Nocardioides sp.]